MSRSPGSVAPFNSIDPLFGTNPIGFAFPTENAPLVFDMATSAMTWYGLVLAKSEGKEIAQNMAIDSNGLPTTDPATAMSGALLPFDRGYKSSGLGMMIEMLAGPLVGSSFCDNKTFDHDWGTLILAIDPELLVNINIFKKKNTELIEIVRNSRTQNNEPVRIPGESSREAYARAFELGTVEIDEEIARELGIQVGK